ncbi:MAG: GNAT family N-acetyltransferase [Lachnospiraceae bacterium]|nr:GNAT family N-acetyltransferase [Lachnospiraceae bacterium]
MKKITSRNFRILCDFMDIYRFMTEIYEKDWRNGVPAPFLEYALVSDWMDKSKVHRYKIWEDNGVIVGLVFYENPVNDVYFSLRPGYEELADEMVAYAKTSMPRVEGKLKLVIFGGQTAIREAAEKAGFAQTFAYDDKVYDFDKPLQYSLPEGFRFVEPENVSLEKLSECCWKGFNHEETEGAWDGEIEYEYYMLMAPHMHPEDAVIVESDSGEYACYAGMWWTPENNLAYMEPLCTIPKYRKMGLAAAALSEHYRRLKPLGATHMTGGGDPFYDKIGYRPMVRWTFWEEQVIAQP